MRKPQLNFSQIWNMSFGFLGIQFGFALQNANVSRIFETLGANISDIPILWIAAPITGLLVQPIIGYMSDKTWGRLGRRRPYFLIGAILASMALFIMPNSTYLWIAAGMLWILDASINISMEPFRALVGDMLPSNQRTTGFALQSFFIGLGAVIASALPWIFTNLLNVKNSAPVGEIPQSVTWSFYVGAIAFIGAVCWTVIKTKEYSPDQLQSFSNETEQSIQAKESGLKEIFNDTMKMPVTMKQLAVVQFFSWFALFAMWIYTTSAVTRHIFMATDSSSSIYNEGANWVGICFAAYNGVAAIFSFALPPLAKLMGRKKVHALSLVLGALGLISINFISNPSLLLLSMVGVGIAWASILSMPYAILAGSLPSNKMGIYMGIFNFFIVIPQIIAASFLGAFIKHIGGNDPLNALVLGGVCMLVAATLVIFVKDIDEVNNVTL